MAITQAVLLGVLVGRVVTGDAFADVLGWLVASLGLRGILAAATEQAARWAGLRVVAVVRLATLRHWLALPEGRRPGTDAAVARATEGVSALEAYVSRYLPALVTGAVVPALTVGTLLVIDPWSALIVVLTLPLLPLFAALIGQHTQAETEQRWGAMALLAGHFLDVVRGLPTLVAYGRADAQVEVVRTVGERHRSATMRTLRTAFLSTAALELLATISVAMVAVAVGLRLAYGAMDLTVGLVAILLAPEAYWPVRRVGQEFHNAADGATVLAELGADGVLGGPADVARAGGLRPGRGLALEHVSYAHPGRERTIVDLTLHAPAGPGLTALVGPSGAGKTTVLELLAGLRVPDVGLVSAPDAHLAGQRPVILPGTVRDNLLLVGGAAAEEGAEGGREDSREAVDSAGAVNARGPDDAPGAVDAPRPSSRTHPGDDELVAALRQVGLWDQLAERDGLKTPLGDDGFGLSAGQRARLALARALLSPAPLVLLDEPTANVAAEAVPALHALITGLARERRVVVVTHDPDLAARLTRCGGSPRPRMVVQHSCATFIVRAMNVTQEPCTSMGWMPPVRLSTPAFPASARPVRKSTHPPTESARTSPGRSSRCRCRPGAAGWWWPASWAGPRSGAGWR
ncbi:ABC transporter ATP-binding protein/permease [Ornithinimicrobium flavum]|uniref:ABC transporter ATP-binding protein/permease n=1 Tax=Ornithinimicrobium flavum TaxID=1288636 RepID=UPI00106FE31D|nr:ABC transporter transmembrane domain-containing protein [Ornithinimicrobium flavum]